MPVTSGSSVSARAYVLVSRALETIPGMKLCLGERNGVPDTLGTRNGDRLRFEHGFSQDRWIAAKQEARQAMIARSKGVIAYSDLVPKITSCILEPNGTHLAHMLGEISSEEDEEGRGLLTVVHKTGDSKPGPG